jgi:hypothetical protein
MMIRKISVSLIAILGAANAVAGSIDVSVTSKSNFNPKSTIQSSSLVRDPFSPSPLMYEVLSRQGTAQGQYGFLPLGTQGDDGVPKMRLKGFIDKGENTLALLEIVGSGTYMVREGDEINIDPRQPYSAIRISEINRLSITVETGYLGSIKVMR